MASMSTPMHEERVSIGSPCEVKELSERREGGLHIQLLWMPAFAEIWLKVEDEKHEVEDIFTRVPNDKALDAFWHPFRYDPELV